ncbi:GFA family protein [Paracidovorax sp. MALMAid1276]|uniref:GFA family protein n=1 Tax=Paracidovorax sp. MALMAid1276 TaxID=3411631 RepID=UPI003B9982D9
MKINPIHKASCHCGAVQIELDLPSGLVDPRHCTCSMCRRRGAIVASVPVQGLKVVKGEDQLKLYQFNTMTAKHYFCAVCGIYTHHQRRSNPEEFSFNIGCLEGLENPFVLEPVRVLDGVHHPADRKVPNG